VISTLRIAYTLSTKYSGEVKTITGSKKEKNEATAGSSFPSLELALERQIPTTILPGPIQGSTDRHHNQEKLPYNHPSPQAILLVSASQVNILTLHSDWKSGLKRCNLCKT
jgi:hypothetical protein